VTIAIVGVVYIAFRVLTGVEFPVALSSFKVIIYNLKPYFSYLTIIPAVLFIFTQIIKNKIKIINLKK
jgi:hypothetical protein